MAAARAQQTKELQIAEQKEAAAVAEVNAFTHQLAQADAAVFAAETEKKNLTGARLLERYLAERANSTDYDEFKGVVALAHRDLESLSTHLLQSVRESAEGEGVRRIVLYIDDLDRCPPQTVADMLAAVHLLLAQPLFTVIVGVDPRWLKTSLTTAHSDMLPGGDGKTSPADYLEKIFQLTYTLPELSEEIGATLLRETLRTTQQADRGSQSAQPASTAVPSTGGDETSAGTTGQTVPAATGLSVSLGLSMTVNRVVQLMQLDDEEIEQISEIAHLVATSPRRAKRFLNVYLVVRARGLADEVLAEGLGKNHFGNLALLVAVALSVAAPETAKELERTDGSAAQTFGNWAGPRM